MRLAWSVVQTDLGLHHSSHSINMTILRVRGHCSRHFASNTSTPGLTHSRGNLCLNSGWSFQPRQWIRDCCFDLGFLWQIGHFTTNRCYSHCTAFIPYTEFVESLHIRGLRKGHTVSMQFSWYSSKDWIGHMPFLFTAYIAAPYSLTFALKTRPPWWYLSFSW